MNTRTIGVVYPAKGMTHWRVASAWQGGTHSRAQVDGFAIGGVDVSRRFAIDIDEPFELGGGNAFANPQEYLLAALNACMIVGYTALCVLQGIVLEKLEITTEGDIDLRGFFGLDPTVAAGYRELRSSVVIKGDGTEEQFRKIYDMVLATSPNFYNITRAVRVAPDLTIEQPKIQSAQRARSQRNGKNPRVKLISPSRNLPARKHGRATDHDGRPCRT